VKPGGDEWSQEGKGLRVRTLKAGGCKALYDVSPVTFPAYPQTSAQVRAMVEKMTADGGQADGGTGQAPGATEEELTRAQARRKAAQRKRWLELLKIK
jgi:hypothetical protein